MASQGPLNPGVVVSATGGDFPQTQTWANTNDAKTSNNFYATTSFVGSDARTHYLRATSFGPSGLVGNEVVNGIVVEIEKSWNGSGGGAADHSVRLFQNSVPVGNNKRIIGSWPIGDAYSTYGGVNDTWGLTLTGADIAHSGFGVGISASGAGAISVVSVDHIRITYYYTGISGANNNLNLFISGFSAQNSGLSLFEQGSQITNSGLTLYLPAFSPSNNNATLFEQGLDQQNNNLPLYISSFSSINNNLNLFEQGLSNYNNNTTLFIGGLYSLNIPSVFTLFEQGHLNSNNNLNLFIYGRATITNENPPNQLPLYIQGNTIDSLFNTFPLFIGGYSNFNNLPTIFTLYEQGSILVASGLPLFIYGEGIITTDTPPPNRLPLYISGPYTSTGYIPLYICGPSIVRMCQFTRYINRVTQVDLEI